MAVGGACLLIALRRVTQLSESLVLARWGDSSMDLHAQCDNQAFMRIILMVVALNCAVVFVIEWNSSRSAKRAAFEFHDRALHSLLQAATGRLFDRQLVGRLVNQLSLDLIANK